MSAGFALLWSKILDSSIWMESKEARLVWITMLAMKDSEGRVYASRNALAHRARVEESECEAALAKFMEPDPQSTSPAKDGRRIEPLEGGGGWRIVNHEQYRFSTEAKREFWKEQKRQQREAEARKKGKPLPRRGKPLAGEKAYLAAEARGEDVSQEPGNRIMPVPDISPSGVPVSTAEESGSPAQSPASGSQSPASGSLFPRSSQGGVRMGPAEAEDEEGWAG